jgi:hypothetical protein
MQFPMATVKKRTTVQTRPGNFVNQITVTSKKKKDVVHALLSL